MSNNHPPAQEAKPETGARRTRRKRGSAVEDKTLYFTPDMVDGEPILRLAKPIKKADALMHSFRTEKPIYQVVAVKADRCEVDGDRLIVSASPV